MAQKRKSWTEKLHNEKDLPRIITIDEKMSKKWGTGTCVIPHPREVDALMKKVPKGKITTINRIREVLALKHGTNIACPITTGIFSWVAAHAAEEANLQGEENITPYWRTLKSDGYLNEKYPGGVEAQKEKIEAEGFRVIQRGKRYQVENYQQYVVGIDELKE